MVFFTTDRDILGEVGVGTGLKYYIRAGVGMEIDARDTNIYTVGIKGLDDSIVKKLNDACIYNVDDILAHPDLTTIKGIGEKTAEQILETIVDG